MNFTDIVNGITVTLDRPDKRADVATEVNAAILFFSQDADFEDDLVEANITLDPNEYTQRIAKNTFPRFRKFQYIKQGVRCEIKPIDTHQLFGSACDMRNRYYWAGSDLVISLANKSAQLASAYFAYPPYLVDGGTYWMLENQWGMVRNRVLAKMFTDIGDAASGVRYETYAAVDFSAFRADKALK